jgi:uncharacterized protein
METLLQVKVSPGASRNEIKSWSSNLLKVRVKAPPEKGKANKELKRFLAKSLGLAQHQIVVRSGETSRIKILAISGLTKGEIVTLLNDYLNLTSHP